MDKWSHRFVLFFIAAGAVLVCLYHIPIKLTKESSDTRSFLNSYSGFPDHLTSIFNHCHHRTMSVPPNMGHESRINTPKQITDLANAFIYSCLVLFSLCHISILVITVTFVLLDKFFSSYRNLVVQTRQRKNKTNHSTLNVPGGIASLLFSKMLHHSKVLFNCLVALFTTVPYLVGICCCYPDKSNEIFPKSFIKSGYSRKNSPSKEIIWYCPVCHISSPSEGQFFMQLLLNELISCLGILTNSLSFFPIGFRMFLNFRDMLLFV